MTKIYTLSNNTHDKIASDMVYNVYGSTDIQQQKRHTSNVMHLYGFTVASGIGYSM